MAKTAANIDWLSNIFITILLVVFGGIVLHAPFSVAFSLLLPNYELLIKSWKEIMLGIALVLMVVILTQQKRWNILLQPLFVCIAAFAALNIALIPVFYTGADATLAGLLINLRYFLFFTMVYVAVTLYPSYGRLFIKVFAAGVAVVLLFAVLQLTILPHDVLKYIGYNETTIMPFLTVDQNMDFVRINSTLRGPNPLGAYVLIAVSVLVAYCARHFRMLTKKGWWAAALVGIAGLATIWATYSRSALVGLAIAVGIVALVSLRGKLLKTIWITMAVVALVIGGSVVVFRDSNFISNVLLHEDPNEGNDINSNDGHAESLIDGSRRVSEQPLGGGIGSTGSASLLTDTPLIIENQYLFIAHETGWIGALLFIAATVMVLIQNWRGRRDWFVLGVFASGVALALIGIIQPVWVDETVAIVWWGLAAIALVRTRGSDILLVADDNKKQTS
jgi:hypothetical protein